MELELKETEQVHFFQHCLWLCGLVVKENQILGDASKIERINRSPFLSPCIVVGVVGSFTAVQQSGLVSRVRLLFSPQDHNTECFWWRLWFHRYCICRIILWNTSSHACFYPNGKITPEATACEPSLWQEPPFFWLHPATPLQQSLIAL